MDQTLSEQINTGEKDQCSPKTPTLEKNNSHPTLLGPTSESGNLIELIELERNIALRFKMPIRAMRKWIDFDGEEDVKRKENTTLVPERLIFQSFYKLRKIENEFAVELFDYAVSNCVTTCHKLTEMRVPRDQAESVLPQCLIIEFVEIGPLRYYKKLVEEKKSEDEEINNYLSKLKSILPQ